MTTSEDKEREFELREAKLKAKEEEIRLRELETEVHQQYKYQEIEVDPLPPLYQTTRQKKAEGSIRKFGRKIVKVAKFLGFAVLSIAVIRFGFFIGMWMAYFFLLGIISFIGYQIFLKDD